ncbi:MAG: hypothetical protein K8F36_11250 [Melioribacteraceae bacterium]|nr:hypothetical protein [Melioribacteraceae bacterium]
MISKIVYIFLISVVTALAQSNLIEGEVSYLSSQNVYVRFSNTTGLSVEDTLFTLSNNVMNPAILIEFLSTTSAAGKPINGYDLKVGDKIYGKKSIAEKPIVEVQEKEVTDDELIKQDSEITQVLESSFKEKINGKLSISTYSNLSNTNSIDYQRWRYTASFRGENLGETPVSVESYLSFNYRSTEWANITENIGKAVKIYSLNAGYEINERMTLSIGRKINRKVSNIGAIDGFQFESNFGDFSTGAIVGSRPNFSDYGYNIKLFEYGAFISHSDTIKNRLIQTSLAAFQQTNDFNTDRRFLYLQHNNSFIENVHLFLSAEIDLYKRENNQEKSDFSFTGIYGSVSYRPISELSFSVSYDSRKNVIYYETFKDYADSLLESARRQGIRIRTTVRPIKYLMLSANYGYRKTEGDQNPSITFGASASYTRVPFVEASLSINYNSLETNYVDGNIFALRMSRDIISGIIYSGLGVRLVDYEYLNTNSKLNQKTVMFDLGWKIMRELSLSFNYEGTFQENITYGRFYLNLTKRF